MLNTASRYLLSLLIVGGTVSASHAYERIVTHYIFGNEIQSIEAGVIGVEDPSSLILQIGLSSDETFELVIESDQPLSDCQTALEGIKGSASAYVEIRAHDTADTMNGVMVLSCTTLIAPGADGL